MLPKEYRLPSQQITQVFKNGSRVSNTILTVIFLRKETPPARGAIVVKRSGAKKSVTRSRIKRTLREALREKLPTLPPHDLVILVQHAPEPISTAAMYNALTPLLEKLKK